jgi:hypothetical protein
MKSSYELAMERLNKQAPSAKVTAAQKAQLADLESLYKSKIADREILVKGQLQKAAEKGDAEAYVQLEKQLVSDRKTLNAEMEEKKDRVRAGKD